MGLHPSGGGVGIRYIVAKKDISIYEIRLTSGFGIN